MTIIVDDEFVEPTTDTDLDQHTPNIDGDQWSLLRVTGTNGAIVKEATNTMDCASDSNDIGVDAYTAKPNPTVTNQAVSIKMLTRQESAATNKGWGMFCRKTDADNYYFCCIHGNTTANQNYHIFKSVAGSVSLLGTTDNSDLADDDVIRFVCTNGSQKIFNNGVEQLATTDSDLDDDVGEWGWYEGGDTTFPDNPESTTLANGWTFDDFVAEELGIERLDTPASNSTTTLSFTVSAGANRALIVCTGYEDFAAAREVTGVDYGGEAMEKIVDIDTADGTSFAGATMWFLDDAGITAASTSVITPTYDTGPDNEMIHAASYENVDQTGGTTSFPANATYEQDEETPNPNTTIDLTEVSGGLILGFNSGGNTGTHLWQADMTEQTDEAASSSSSSLSDRKSITDANVTIECTISGAPPRHVGISVRLAFDAGGVPAGFPIVIEATQIINVTSNASTTGSVTLTLGTIAENDIILPIIAIDGDAANPTATPATYATITSTSQGATELYYLWKRQGGTPDTTITINWTGNEQCRVMLLRVSGVIQTGDPWDVISSAVTNSASTTNVINQLTSTVINTLAVHAVAVDRDRVDSSDTITGTGWSQVGVSGSSGGANGAGLIVGENELPTVIQVAAGTFGTWASDQNASRGFNLKPPGIAPSAAVVRGIALNPSAII